MSNLEPNQSLLSDGRTVVTEVFPGQFRKARGIWNSTKPHMYRSQVDSALSASMNRKGN